MEEKKLTDDAEIDVGMIVKALECCKKNEVEDTCEYCYGCPASDWDFEEDITECIVDLFQKAINLIHRLKKENEELKSPKFASWKLKFFNLKEEFDKELAEHEEFTKKAKAEIERLTEEKTESAKTAVEVLEQNIELQKQVDELKDSIEQGNKVCKECQGDKDKGLKACRKQAVKDTAKEIFERLAKRKHQGVDLGGFFVEYHLRLEDLNWFEVKYGVEVE